MHIIIIVKDYFKVREDRNLLIKLWLLTNFIGLGPCCILFDQKMYNIISNTIRNISFCFAWRHQTLSLASRCVAGDKVLFPSCSCLLAGIQDCHRVQNVLLYRKLLPSIICSLTLIIVITAVVINSISSSTISAVGRFIAWGINLGFCSGFNKIDHKNHFIVSVHG